MQYITEMKMNELDLTLINLKMHWVKKQGISQNMENDTFM